MTARGLPRTQLENENVAHSTGDHRRLYRPMRRTSRQLCCVKNLRTSLQILSTLFTEALIPIYRDPHGTSILSVSSRRPGRQSTSWDPRVRAVSVYRYHR